MTAGLRLCRAWCMCMPRGPGRGSSPALLTELCGCVVRCVVGVGAINHSLLPAGGLVGELNWIGGGGVKEEKQRRMHLSPPALTIPRRATVERARRETLSLVLY